MLHSDHACRNIIMLVGEEMKKNLAHFLVESGTNCSIMINKSTTVSNKTCLIIYLHLSFEGVACNYFFDIVELESGTGECIFSTLLAALEKYGITNDVLKNDLVGIATDGTLTMLAPYKGVAALLRSHLHKDLTVVHCMNHKVELAVHDVMNDVADVYYIQVFLDSLYSVFSRSPKNQRLLQSVSQELSSQLLKLGRIFRVDLVASSFNAVRTLLESHSSLVHLFEKLINDGFRSTQERSKFEGLLKHLTKLLLVMVLVMLYEALDILQVLPFFMQNRNSSVLKAKQEIDMAIRTLETLKTNDSPRFRMIVQELEEKRTFKGVLIKEPSCAEYNRFQTFQKKLFQSLDVALLISDTWPSDDYEHVFYGDMSISRLCNEVNFKLRKSTRASLVKDFRIYKENPQHMPNSVKELVKTVKVIPISMAKM
ncbi:E3 SUMO-protein ligase KIAA1586-like [Schistocerca piceifrons]|uniref:E3 SUMO-protein ligase KIAA1586-like n=1 Tax=Schistocerca piceifrons TaxID=274613 RepID=UPI001F5EEBA9|nr:E3 SUMO-protein ligase KIAA1586-like [Schistocerca piceifrons]